MTNPDDRLLDYLVVDLPPGSSAEPLLRAMATSNAGVVVVTAQPDSALRVGDARSDAQP